MSTSLIHQIPVLRSMTIPFADTTLDLLPEKAVYLPHSASLVIGDVHIGKTTDMLREGIQVPIQVALSNPYRIGEMIERYSVEKCYFLGDLFHSRHNPEFSLISELVYSHSAVEFVLVRGNHEILDDADYEQLGLRTVEEEVVEGILLRHHPELACDTPMMSAHIHPKVRLIGKGRQSVSLPVFARRGHCLILPAFGAMTGGYGIDKEEYDGIYVVAERQVMRMK